VSRHGVFARTGAGEQIPGLRFLLPECRESAPEERCGGRGRTRSVEARDSSDGGRQRRALSYVQVMLGLCRLVTVAAAVIALTVCGGAASSAAGSPRWAIVASGNSVPSLLAVSALADNQVWAVGSTGHGNAARPAVAFWDGSSLQVVNLLGSASRGWLEGVSALSSDDVWAVGSTTPGAASKSRSLVTHWDGQHWNLMRLPVLPAASDLRDVKAFASDDVWAVGNAGADRALVLHFDGHAWRRVDTSNVAPAVRVSARSTAAPRPTSGRSAARTLTAPPSAGPT
jgi:hypothetical protein